MITTDEIWIGILEGSPRENPKIQNAGAELHLANSDLLSMQW